MANIKPKTLLRRSRLATVCCSCLKACNAPCSSVCSCLFNAACISSVVMRLSNCTQAVSSACNRLAVLLTMRSGLVHINITTKKLIMPHQTGTLALSGVKTARNKVAKKPTMEAQAMARGRRAAAKRGMETFAAACIVCVRRVLSMPPALPFPWAINFIRHVCLAANSSMASRFRSTSALACGVWPGNWVSAAANDLLPPVETVRLSR